MVKFWVEFSEEKAQSHGTTVEVLLAACRYYLGIFPDETTEVCPGYWEQPESGEIGRYGVLMGHIEDCFPVYDCVTKMGWDLDGDVEDCIAEAKKCWAERPDWHPDWSNRDDITPFLRAVVGAREGTLRCRAKRAQVEAEKAEAKRRKEEARKKRGRPLTKREKCTQLLAPCREDELALVRGLAQLFIKNTGEARVNKAQFDAELDEARRQHTDGQCQDARTAIREVAQDCGLSDPAPETPLDETATLMSCLHGEEWSLVRKLSQQMLLSRGETLPEIL